jgi:2-polyprenyl-3-methyl-5-hydroxy-6-metoxy-1,4-benzoquinol methylase
MTLISDEYRLTNIELHRRNHTYGSYGSRWAPLVRELKEKFAAESILDYGCGKGTLAEALPDLGLREYDPCVVGKDAPPAPADLVICTDVLEHIEPELIDNVIEHIWSVTLKVAFLNISTRRAAKRLPDGRNAHLIVQDPDWWTVRVELCFDIQESQALTETSEFNCVVTPRKQGDRMSRAGSTA